MNKIFAYLPFPVSVVLSSVLRLEVLTEQNNFLPCAMYVTPIAGSCTSHQCSDCQNASHLLIKN
jgi:hypothetical protein